jgi:putative ATP-dependent endonuclease of the OLD family
VARLKSEDRAAGGLKQNQVAYEAVANVIGALDQCCGRARRLLNAVSDVLLGGVSPMFADAPQGDPKVKILQP